MSTDLAIARGVKALLTRTSSAARQWTLKSLREAAAASPPANSGVFSALRQLAMEGMAKGTLTVLSVAHQAVIELEAAAVTLAEKTKRLAQVEQELAAARAQLQQLPAVDPGTATLLATCQANLDKANAEKEILTGLLAYHTDAPRLEKLAEATFDAIGSFLNSVAASTQDPNALSQLLSNYSYKSRLAAIPVLGPEVYKVITRTFTTSPLPPKELALKLKQNIAASLADIASQKNSRIVLAAFNAFQATANSIPQPTPVQVPPAPQTALPAFPVPDQRTTEEKLRTLDPGDKKALAGILADFPSIAALLTHPDPTLSSRAKALAVIYLIGTSLPMAQQGGSISNNVFSFINFIGCDSGRNPATLIVINDLLNQISVDQKISPTIRSTADYFGQELATYIPART